MKNSSFEYHSNTNSFTNHTATRENNLKNYGTHKGKVNNEDFNEAYKSTSTVSLFGSGLQKTFATGNLSRICQIPVINPMNKSNGSNFNDDSEPIYTDPSLFERSRSVKFKKNGITIVYKKNYFFFLPAFNQQGA